jgi:hypothetical protein
VLVLGLTMVWDNEIRADRETIERFVAAFNAGLIQLEIKIIDDNDVTNFLPERLATISPKRFEIEARQRSPREGSPWLITHRSLAR